MARTPEEIFQHHAQALGAGDLDEIVPNAAWDLKTLIFEGDALFLEWAADAGATRADDGLDTFIFRDGQIRLQAVRYTLQRL